MCVFWRSLCLNFLNWETILRDYCVDWIIGWVVCWIAFISVFFSSRKTVLKSWLDTFSTPTRYLAICRASQAFFLLQSRHLLDTWWIDQGSVLGFDSLLLDTCLIPQLSTTIFSTPTSTASLTPLDTSSVEYYWRFYLNLLRNPSLISSISLDLSTPVHLPNTLSFTPNLFLKVSSSFFKFFYTW